MKSIADYMNDPRILNDPDMAEALEPIKEIHAARLMLQDETVGMTNVEKVAFINAKGKETLAQFGLTPKIANFSGHGKLKSHAIVGQ